MTLGYLERFSRVDAHVDAFEVVLQQTLAKNGSLDFSRAGLPDVRETVLRIRDGQFGQWTVY